MVRTQATSSGIPHSPVFCETGDGQRQRGGGSLPVFHPPMAASGDGARRFMKALARMLLVACSLPYPGATDGSSAAEALVDGRRGGTSAVDAAPPAGSESAGLLLDGGANMLLEGKSKDAVSVLDAAITAWEEEVSNKKNNR